MATVPKRVAERLSAGLKRYQPVLDAARARDVNESDTSMIVSDMLADVFGFDKYTEITRELCIRGTYCDLAIRIDQKFQFLIEVKPIGVELKEQHVKQAIDYAANQGIEWVALTNGVCWKVYRVSFAKPIDKELVVDLAIQTLSPVQAKKKLSRAASRMLRIRKQDEGDGEESVAASAEAEAMNPSPTASV